VKFAWIRRHKDAFPMAAMCKVLGVSRSGYYAWVGRPPGTRGQRKEQLMQAIQKAFDDNRQVYGSPRLHEELVARGVACCVNTVAKYMKEAGISPKPPKPFRVMTTDSNHTHPIAANLLDRQFSRSEPNAAWCADITYVPTRQGWLFVALVIDLFSRRIVGYAMADHLRASLVIDALSMALDRRRPPGGWRGRDLLAHSDRGVQYACAAYRTLLAAHGVTASMSRTGNCYDNAVMESFIATLKRELTDRCDYQDRQQATRSIIEYIEVFYNQQRRHSVLGYVSPAQFEQAAA